MSRRASASKSTDFLYRDLAQQLAAAMQAGSLRVGDRIPSVRRLSAQHSVSISTAVQALRYLENQRLIEARPKSGFFVSRPPRELPEPAASRPPLGARYVVTQMLLREYIESLTLPGVIRLGVLFPDASMFPVQRVARLLASVTRREPELAITHHTYETGDQALRQAIARRALESGVRIGADDVIVTAGCMEAVYLALRAIGRPGDTIAIESPTYFPLLQNIETLGMKVLEIPTHPRTGISIDAVDLATQKPGAVRALLLVPTYSNPMGSSMPDENRKRLVALCAERDIPIIEDDIYGEVTFDEVRSKPLKAWDLSNNVLLCSSFGKTVAPALRIGWILPGRHQKEVELLKLAHIMFTAQAPQLALAEFVANGGYDRHLRKLRSTLRDQAERMRDAITRSFPPGTRVSRPMGGYVIWIELPAGVDAVELFRRARAVGIVIAPGPLFTTTNRFKNCIRLSYSQRWSRDIEDAVSRVGALARELDQSR